MNSRALSGSRMPGFLKFEGEVADEVLRAGHGLHVVAVAGAAAELAVAAVGEALARAGVPEVAGGGDHGGRGAEAPAPALLCLP